MSFQFRRGLEENRLMLSGGAGPYDKPVDGEPLWVTNTEKLYVGNGTGGTTGGILIGPITTLPYSALTSTGHTHDYVAPYTNVVFDNITATSITTTGSSVHTTDVHATGVVNAGNLSAQTLYIKRTSAFSPIFFADNSAPNAGLINFSSGIFNLNTGLTLAAGVLKSPSISGTSISATTYYCGATNLTSVFSSIGGGSTELTGLTDVNISSVLDGQVLSYDSGTEKWINYTSPAGVTDHGLLDPASLLDPDHPQYRLTASTSPISATTYYSGNNNLLNVLSPTGHTHAFSTITSTGHGHYASSISGAGSLTEAQSTFGIGWTTAEYTTGLHWFPGSLLVNGKDLYLNASNVNNETQIIFPNGGYLLHNQSQNQFRWGPSTVNTILYGDCYVGGNQLYLSNPVGGAGGNINVNGSGIYFGTGASHNLTYQSTPVAISASTKLIAPSLTATTISADTIYSGGNNIFNVLSPSGHTHPASAITSGTFSTGDYIFSGNVLADNLELGNRLYLNVTDSYDESQILFNSAATQFLLYNTGATEFRMSDKFYTSGDVLSNRVGTAYFNTGTTETGTTILNFYPWDFAPYLLDRGYTWNFTEGATQWYSGLFDHTVVFDDTTNDYHIIGIRAVYDISSNVHPILHRTTFIHAKTKNFSAGSFYEVGVIDTLGGNLTTPKYIDGQPVGMIFAPHIVKHDSAYYMFYAGIDALTFPQKERMFVAKSYDMSDWSSPEIRYLFDSSGPSWAPENPTACRDPFVIRDDTNNRWTMFATVEVLSGSSDSFSGGGSYANSSIQVVGILTSTTLMSGWNLVDWVRTSEKVVDPYYGNGESPCVFQGTDGNYYLSWSVKTVNQYTNTTAFASASTISLNGAEWAHIPSMIGTNILGPATEITKSPYSENLWICTTISAYTIGNMRCDIALTFTGSGQLSYTAHSAMSIGYSSYTPSVNRINLTDTLIGHTNEHNIHYDICELDNRYPSLLHTHEYSSITSTAHTHDFSTITLTGHTHGASQISGGTFATGAEFIFPTGVNLGQGLTGKSAYFTNTITGDTIVAKTHMSAGSRLTLSRSGTTDVLITMGTQTGEYHSITMDQDGSGHNSKFLFSTATTINGILSATTIVSSGYSGSLNPNIIVPGKFGNSGNSSNFTFGNHVMFDNSYTNTATTNATVYLGTTGDAKWVIFVDRDTDDLGVTAGGSHGGNTTWGFGQFSVASNIHGRSAIAAWNGLYVGYSGAIPVITSGTGLGATISGYSIDAKVYSGISFTKSITVPDPRANENITMFYLDRDVSFTKAIGVVSGNTTASATWEIASGLTRTGSTGTITGASTTSKDGVVYTIADRNVPANTWVFLKTSATAATITELHLTVQYREL